MRRAGIVAAVIAIAVGGGAIYAVSPYFTESTIDEALPDVIMASDMVEMSEGIGTEGMAGEPMVDGPMASYSGTFVGVGDGIHDARGTAKVLELAGSGGEILRLEDFFSTNGPGLRVYLSVDTEASDYVDLGDLKANRGNQNYEIPEGTDISMYGTVLIWCEPFSVLFGSAELA